MHNDKSMTSTGTSTTGLNRWLIAVMGCLLQVTLGTIYAWSYFQKPLMAYAGWNNQQVAWILSLAICFLGLSAAVGGLLLPTLGPRKLAVAGALLYAAGWLTGGLALQMKSLMLLYFGMGIVGGIGLGLGYVTPVATAAKWFPDKKGLVTGMVVMGFGLGALLMSKLLAPTFAALCPVSDAAIQTDWAKVFYLIAAALAAAGLTAASYMQNPPASVQPCSSSPVGYVNGAGTEHPAKACICSSRFALMFLIFFCNITAGIMFIGFQSPMLQDLIKSATPHATAPELAAAGATLIAASSLFNGIGRLFWGAISDHIGQTRAFRLILGTQLCVFIGLTQVNSPAMFSILVCYILLCYGGGFGTMPSFVLTVFGSKPMAAVYGCILTAWSLAGLIGPQVVALLKDTLPAQQAAYYTFIIGAAVLATGFALSFAVSDKSFEQKKPPQL